MEQEPTTSTEEIPVLHCYRHPDRETMLRCNQCDQPICPECAVRTPTGYRCKECIRGQQKAFDTAGIRDVVLAGIVAAVLSFIGASISAGLGFWTIFIAPTAGVVTAEAVRWVSRRHRSKTLFWVAAGGAVLGALPVVITNLVFFNLYGLLWPSVYTFLVATTVYARISGIQL